MTGLRIQSRIGPAQIFARTDKPLPGRAPGDPPRPQALRPSDRRLRAGPGVHHHHPPPRRQAHLPGHGPARGRALPRVGNAVLPQGRRRPGRFHRRRLGPRDRADAPPGRPGPAGQEDPDAPAKGTWGRGNPYIGANDNSADGGALDVQDEDDDRS
ncbi:MAG: hypothetical protein MZV64_22775 [Ignavibacteriales bacterium]|nr:hypothetical protein [Ignavibacteriales bacterium]